MPNLKKNMKVRVSVLVNGTWVVGASPNDPPTTSFSLIQYSMQSSIPNPNGTLVDSAGDIDLSKIDPGSVYANATDIEFSIDQQSNFTDASGTKMNLSFPQDDSALDFTDATAGTEFELHDTANPNTIAFTDLDDRSGTYGYCITLISQYTNDPRTFPFALDPNIVNKPQ